MRRSMVSTLVAVLCLAWAPRQVDLAELQEQTAETEWVDTVWICIPDAAQEMPLPSVRRIDDAAWEEATEDIDYREKSPPPPKESRDIDSGPLILPPVFLLYGLLGLILLLVFGVIARNILQRRKGDATAPETQQNIEEEDLPAELDLQALRANALANADWAAAYRWSFLLLLADLSARDWITWVRDGTNRLYAEELKALGDPDLVGDFRHLGRAFERLRYGQGTMDQVRFETLDKRLEAFHARTLRVPANQTKPAS